MSQRRLLFTFFSRIIDRYIIWIFYFFPQSAKYNTRWDGRTKAALYSLSAPRAPQHESSVVTQSIINQRVFISTNALTEVKKADGEKAANKQLDKAPLADAAMTGCNLRYTLKKRLHKINTRGRMTISAPT